MRLIIVLLSLFFSVGVGNGTEINIVTEHFPPYQIVENNKIQGGFSVEVVKELLDETGIEAPIIAYPWARAYRMSLNGENVLIFSMIRNEEREKHFKWVGSLIGTKDYYFWSLKNSKDIKINSLEEAKRYSIGVPRDNYQHQFLKNNGFTNLSITDDFDTALKMLYAQRIQAVMGSEISIAYRMRKLNLDYSMLKKHYKIGQSWGDLSIAFSKNTPDELVTKFQLALMKIKNNGTYDRILKSWIP